MRNIQLLEYLGNGYSLLNRNTNYKPFVVALEYDHNEWSHGHYFDRVSEALEWYDNKFNNIELDDDDDVFDRINDVIFSDDDYIDLNLDDDDFDKIVTELLGY